MLNAVPYFVDIVNYNLNVPMADPIFSLSNSDMVFDLVMGRVSIFVQCDVEAFFRFAEANKVKVRWIKGKEAESVKKFSKRWPGTETMARNRCLGNPGGARQREPYDTTIWIHHSPLCQLHCSAPAS